MVIPSYKLGPDDQIFDEPEENEKGPSVKDVVDKETKDLSAQQKRLSVRDLACKFDKNLAAAAKLVDEAKLNEVTSLEGHVMLKKLRDALESTRGRMDGRNKEEVETAISMANILFTLEVLIGRMYRDNEITYLSRIIVSSS